MTVPYVAQGPLLCGGASAAMLERFWGALGVYAEDYEALVSPEAGGIRTGDLTRALTRRGHRVDVLRGEPEEALAQVRTDIPVMALLESGESRYHYVVVVAVGPGEIRYHDPLKGPGRSLSRSDFLRRWAASDHWAAVVWPAFPEEEPGAGGTPAGDDAPGSEATEEEAPLPAPLAKALEELREGRAGAARDRVASFLAEAPRGADHRDTAWDMLASARYLAGDGPGALQAWNRVGRPEVDLVQLRGLQALRYRTVASPLGIGTREVLTPRALRLARRRLLQQPAVQLGRVGYRPLRDGSVEVEAAVLERRRSPLAPAELVGTALGALVNERAEASFGPLLSVGERWRLAGSWEEARPRVEAEVAVPWTPLSAVVTLRSGWMEERFAGTAPEEAWDRRWGSATLERWMGPRLRLGTTLGLERWAGRGRLGRMGVSGLASFASDDLRLGASMDGWTGSGSGFTRLRLGSLLRHRPDPRREWRLTVGASVASGGSPPTIWDGAGTGRIRAPLLRGHRLLEDGRMGGPTLGRVLVHGTVGHAWLLPLGPARLAVELFVDGARIGDSLEGEGPRSYADPGVELRLSGGDRVVAVSLARGGGDWVLSARVGSGTLPWLTVP